jgi:hypothetical protein
MRQLGEPVHSYDDLHHILRQRWDDLNVPAEVLDELAGLPSRYIVKLLGPRKTRMLGPVSFGALLGALGGGNSGD